MGLDKIQPVRTDTRGKAFYGHATNKTYTTDSSSITRPIAYGITGFFAVIGVLVMLVSLITMRSNFIGGFVYLLIGGFITFVGVFGFFKSKSDIDKIEERKKQTDTNYGTISPEQERAELIADVKGGMKDVVQETMSQANIQNVKTNNPKFLWVVLGIIGFVFFLMFFMIMLVILMR